MIGYLDCSTGVSGDKLLGALLDVGETTGRFGAQDLTALVAGLAPEARVEIARVSSRGVSAVGLRVAVEGKSPHRHLADIVAILDAASLPDGVREGALATFTRLAEAEAHVHGSTPERVHFHEVGGTDAIVDIVGVHAGLHALGLEALVCSPVALGSGTVECAHGTLPVPAPATAALVVGMPVTAGAAIGELTTPTGAALLATLASGFGLCPPMTPRFVGYGAGTRDIGMPNVCRLTLGEAAAPAGELRDESVTLLESNVDHVSPEAAAFALQQLVDEGALDAWIAPIVMKKGRAAMLLSVLVADADAGRFLERLVALTGTLGVRRSRIDRAVAERDSVSVDTSWGPVRAKVGAGVARPEADDVARIARETGQPYLAVEQELRSLLAEASER